MSFSIAVAGACSAGRAASDSRCQWSLPDSQALAILVAMPLVDHLSLADVKNRLSEVVDRLEREHGRVVITKHGRPAAVILSVDDLESLEETLEVLSNPTLMADIREAEAERVAGQTSALTKDEALAQFRSR